ncbi:MAG: RNA methyltransferase [Mogibacterium sp.]|nr:RNA methyltransferase [Mogibacterium sp.]MBQ6455831.1 RNA methyltransferase [Mogibacterium sp.]
MLIRIASQDNSRIRLIRKLQTRKGRTAEGRFACEGINMVSEAIRRDLDIDFIMVPEGACFGLIDECIAADDITVCEVPEGIFNKLTDAENGVGILAVVRMPHTDIQAIDSLPGGSNVLVLDRIQDPGNMGTMIRTAVAAGYSMIIAVKGTADVWSPKVLRSTAGMVFDIPIAYVSGPEELSTVLRRAGKRIVVTDPAGGRPYYEEDLRSNVALVIGNEGNGISDEVMDLADVRVTLPMKGETESLNAAVSAAILMYEAVRN